MAVLGGMLGYGIGAALWDGGVDRYFYEHVPGFTPEVFEDVACQSHIVEMHHGGPPEIEVTGEDSARARWALVYHLMNTETQTVSVCGGYYDDEYRRVDGRWWITKARFRVCSAVTYGYKKAALRMLHAAQSLPETV